MIHDDEPPFPPRWPRSPEQVLSEFRDAYSELMAIAESTAAAREERRRFWLLHPPSPFKFPVEPKPKPKPPKQPKGDGYQRLDALKLAAISRLAEQHPDWSLVRIATVIGCDKRTVRRHLHRPVTVALCR